MLRGKRYRFRPGLVIVSAFLLLAAACGDGDEAPAPADTQAPAATEAAAPETTMADEMAMTTDEPIKLGYISGGDADPFVFIVTESIREAGCGGRGGVVRV